MESWGRRQLYRNRWWRQRHTQHRWHYQPHSQHRSKLRKLAKLCPCQCMARTGRSDTTRMKSSEREQKWSSALLGPVTLRDMFRSPRAYSKKWGIRSRREFRARPSAARTKRQGIISSSIISSSIISSSKTQQPQLGLWVESILYSSVLDFSYGPHTRWTGSQMTEDE